MASIIIYLYDWETKEVNLNKHGVEADIRLGDHNVHPRLESRRAELADTRNKEGIHTSQRQ